MYVALVLIGVLVLLFFAFRAMFPQEGSDGAAHNASPMPTPYVRYVRAVQGEVNRIFAFANKVCASREARRILDGVNVTGQVDAALSCRTS